MFKKGTLDSVKRAAIKNELTDAMKRLRYAGEGFEFQIAPGEEGIFAIVIEDVMRENPDFSFVAWASGPAIVRRKDIDAINPDFKRVNEAQGFIEHGGDSFSIEAVDPRPMAAPSGGNITPKEYAKQMPDAAEKYGIPEIGKKE